MSAEIQIILTDEAQRLLAQMKDADKRILNAVRVVMNYQNQLTVARIRQMKLSGAGPDTLRVRTGRLRKSINATPAVIIGNGVQSAIGSNVVYAGIHEFGGQTKPHWIKAKNKKALAFGFRGNMMFRKKVRHPGSVIKARAYIRSSFEERREEIGLAMSQAIVNAATGKQ